MVPSAPITSNEGACSPTVASVVVLSSVSLVKLMTIVAAKINENRKINFFMILGVD
jgi:hypothetical protein